MGICPPEVLAMNDILLFSSLIAGWIVLNLWVRPLFGIQTCLSGVCRRGHAEKGAPLITTDEAARVTRTVHDRGRS